MNCWLEVMTIHYHAKASAVEQSVAELAGMQS